MSKIFFTSDLHVGHKNILCYDGRNFNSIEEMDAEIIKRWNETVTAEDTVYILGDVSWYTPTKTTDFVNKLNGTKILIKGNHDGNSLKNQSCFQQVMPYAEIAVNGQFVVLSHYPIHFYNGAHRGAIMLYGHVHNSCEENITQNFRKQLQQLGIPCRMFNVGCMMWDYKPVTLEEILATENVEEVDDHE